MARVKRGVTTHARHRKVINLARGYRGRGNSSYRVALGKVEKALRYAYRDRRNRKRDFRALWIQRINAAARQDGLTYGRFMEGMRRSGIDLNRKMLAELAAREPDSFSQLLDRVKQTLGQVQS